MDTFSLVKAVSNSSQRSDKGVIFAKRFAKQLYVGVKSAVVLVEIIAPNLAYQLFTCKGDAFVFDRTDDLKLCAERRNNNAGFDIPAVKPHQKENRDHDASAD